MNSLITQYHDEAKQKVIDQLSRTTDRELQDPSLPYTFFEQRKLTLPKLNLQSVPDPEIGSQKFTLSNVPPGVGVSMSGRDTPYIRYNVPIKGTTKFLSDLCQHLLVPRFKTIDHGNFTCSYYSNNPSFSEQDMEDIKEDFRKSALGINGYIDQLEPENEKLNGDLKEYIIQEVSNEISRRNDRQKLRKGLNPFA